MGLKLQGMLIKKDYSEHPTSLFDKLGVDSFQEVTKTSFGDYWNGLQPKGSIVVTSYNKVTILNCDSHFISSERIKSDLSLDTEVCAFIQYDTINAFSFDFFKDGSAIRRCYYDRATGKTHIEEGNPLSFEPQQPNVEKRFYNMTEYFLGIRMDHSTLHNNASSIEYRFTYRYPNFLTRILKPKEYKRHNYWIKYFG